MKDGGFVPFDYTVVDAGIAPLAPDGFVAVDRCENGEAVSRIADIYGTGADQVALAEHIVSRLTAIYSTKRGN